VTPLEVRALALAYELSRLLGELSDRSKLRRRSYLEAAWDRTEEVIGTLEPAENGVPRLRLVIQDGEEVLS
jgi:hypothetical protein